MGHGKGCYTTFHHRYHIIWALKYRYKVQIGDARLRVREIIPQATSPKTSTWAILSGISARTASAPHHDPTGISRQVSQGDDKIACSGTVDA